MDLRKSEEELKGKVLLSGHIYCLSFQVPFANKLCRFPHYLHKRLSIKAVTKTKFYLSSSLWDVEKSLLQSSNSSQEVLLSRIFFCS